MKRTKQTEGSIFIEFILLKGQLVQNGKRSLRVQYLTTAGADSLFGKTPKWGVSFCDHHSKDSYSLYKG